MHKSRKVFKDRGTGQPSVVYDIYPQEKIVEGLEGRSLKAETSDIYDIAELPKVSSIFGGMEGSLKTADAKTMDLVKGVYWLLPPVLGISYFEIEGGYSICLRVLVADVVCCKLSKSVLSAHLPLELVLARADIEVGMDLKEIFWHGKACYRGFDTAWRWRCVDGRGAIIRF